MHDRQAASKLAWDRHRDTYIAASARRKAGEPALGRIYPIHGGALSHREQYRSEYQCWQNIKKRCLNQQHPQYRNYGGRGIAICDAWRSDFGQFLSDVGAKPSAGVSLDRIDNDGNYEPGNVRWATPREQNNNKRQPERFIAERETWGIFRDKSLLWAF